MNEWMNEYSQLTGRNKTDQSKRTIDPIDEIQLGNQLITFRFQIGELTEELADDNKSLIWFLVKQVRPGMDLSKVVLPTFILEPRSFLDKLSDYYYHADILSRLTLRHVSVNDSLSIKRGHWIESTFVQIRWLKEFEVKGIGFAVQFVSNSSEPLQFCRVEV